MPAAQARGTIIRRASHYSTLGLRQAVQLSHMQKQLVESKSAKLLLLACGNLAADQMVQHAVQLDVAADGQSGPAAPAEATVTSHVLSPTVNTSSAVGASYETPDRSGCLGASG